MKRIISLILLVTASCVCFADKLDSLEYLLKEKSVTQEKIYIHTDNNCYFVGDTLWYKAYVVMADSLKPTRYSKVLYVELLTPDGYLVERQQLYIRDDGTAACQFALSDSLYSGYYEVRAYTKWQLNFNRKIRPHSSQNRNVFYSKKFETDYFREYEGLYSRVFPIYEKPTEIGNYADKRIIPRPKQRIYADKPALKVKFYPEGGHIIEGMDCRIAFEVKDNDGQELGSSVGALDNGLFIKPSHGGRGVFEYNAQKPPKEATFEYMDKKYTFPLPTAQASGVVIRGDKQTKGGREFVVKAKGVTVAAYSVTCRGRLITFGRNPGERIALANCPTGINDLTLYDEQGRPLASRLFFVNNHDLGNAVDLSMSSDNNVIDSKTTLAPYAQVNLKLSSATPLSIAVHDHASQDASYDDGNMLTDMLLGGELHGFVANVSQYFKEGAEENLDLLMMVQGWRRYKRIDKIYFLPERYMTYEGQVLNVPSNGNIIDIDDIVDDNTVHYLEKKYGMDYVLISPTGVGNNNVLYRDGYEKFSGRMRENQRIAEGEQKNNPLANFSIPQVNIATSDESNTIFPEEDNHLITYKKFKKKNIVVEGEIVKGTETGDVKAQVDENGFFKINLPWFTDQAILFLTAYANDDSLKLGLHSVKNSKRMDETQYPKYYVKRQLDFPMFCEPYSWYQCNLPEDEYDNIPEDDAALGPENNRLAGEHYLKNVTVKKFRNSKHKLNYQKPAIVVDAYKLYNDVTDYGLSYGILDMTRFVKQASTYLFGYLDQPVDVKIKGLINDNKTTFYRNYIQTSNESDIPMTSTAMLPLLRLNKMKNIRAYTDYDKRNGTHLEVDGQAAVTVSIEPVDGKRYTYRDRRYILDGITYAEEFYQPDYSNVKPAEPTDYRRTLYWNPYATPDADGVFCATFYNNSSKATRVDVSACGLDKNGQIYVK